MKNYRTKIISNQEISPGYFRMRILAPGFGAKARSGQFVMFRVQRSLPPLLRRPFGIFKTGFMEPDCDDMRNVASEDRAYKESQDDRRNDPHDEILDHHGADKKGLGLHFDDSPGENV